MRVRVEKVLRGGVGLLACLGLSTAWAQESRIIRDTLHSPALEGNLLGNSPDREVVVYLPPSYSEAPDKRYPVVYVLHGNGFGRDLTTHYGEPLLPLVDSLVQEGVIGEMILVCPDSFGVHGGSQYANSTVSGGWADYIVQDLVAHVDETYRTLAKPESRGLTGSSMGGRGALDLSLKYPGVFGVVYARSAGQMAYHRFRVGTDAAWRELLTSRDPDTTERPLRRLLGFAVAFSPNPEAPPYYADLPVVLEGDGVEPVASVWKRWAEFDPVQVAERSAEPLRGLRALSIDCGTSDRLIEANRMLSDTLKRQGIPHVYEEYEGGHTDRQAERMRTKVLPMLAAHLVFE